MDKQNGGISRGPAALFRGILVFIWVVVSTVIYGLPVLLIWPVTRNASIAIAKSWCRHWLWLSGIRVKVSGLHRLQTDGRYVFLANHQSAADIPVLYVHLPFKLAFIAKKELFYTPFFGWGMAVIGHIWIDRTNARKARGSLQRAMMHLRTRGFSLILFPEGTRSVDGTLGEFKKGSFSIAIETGVEIVPVAIKGIREVLPKKSLFVSPGTVELEIGKPIGVEGLKAQDKPVLADKVYAEIARMLEEGSQERTSERENMRA